MNSIRRNGVGRLTSTTVTVLCPNGHLQSHDVGGSEERVARDTVTLRCGVCRVSWTATAEDLRRWLAMMHGPDPRD
jgi:hypothetical protein